MTLISELRFHGLTGELLDFASEWGSVPGNLMHHMAFFSAAVGKSPYVYWRGEIYANLSVMIVGESGCGKGESLRIIQKIYDFSNPTDQNLTAPTLYGTVSGNEFVPKIHHTLLSKEDGEVRILNIDEECNARFKSAAIWNSRHDETYCKAFDGSPITGSLGNKSITISNLHFGSIGHVTPAALNRSMQRDSFFNGFVNRSIWATIPEQEFRASDGAYDKQSLVTLQENLANSLHEGSAREYIQMSSEAKSKFEEYSSYHYAAMRSSRNDLLRNLTQRLPILCLKTAMILSL